MLTRVAAADATLPSVEEAVAFWKLNGLKRSTTIIYQRWVHRFISDCTHRGISPAAHLTSKEVCRFAIREARRCQINREEAQRMAHMSLHVWSMSLATFGVQLPVWSEPKTVFRPVPPVLTEYSDYRRAHSNAKDVSINQETKYISSWLRFLHSRHRKLRAIRLSDVDAFLFRLRRH